MTSTEQRSRSAANLIADPLGADGEDKAQRLERRRPKRAVRSFLRFP